LAGREGTGIDLARSLTRARTVMNPNSAEIMPEAWFEERSLTQ
jgi:hypothetical protein